MSFGAITIKTEGNICDLCHKPIDEGDRSMTIWMDGGNLNKTIWYRFKTMFGGKTGTAYDAHGQCAADVLTRYIEKGGRL